MRQNKRILYCSYLIMFNAVISLLLGVIYCTISRPMPYHLAYLGISFEDIRTFNPKLAIFVMILIKGAGIGLLSLGMFEIGIALKPFRQVERWAWYTMWPAVLVVVVPLLFITIYMNTSAKWLVLFYLAVFLLAMIIPAKDFLISDVQQ